MSSTVLTFVIVGLDDHPIFEADLVTRGNIPPELLHRVVSYSSSQSRSERLLAEQGRQDLETTGRSTCISLSSMQPLMQLRISSGRVQT